MAKFDERFRGRDGVSTYFADSTSLGLFLDEFIRPLITRAVSSLDRVGMPMTPEQSFYCIFSLIGQLLHAVKGQHMSAQLERVGETPFDLNGFIDHFVRFSAAGIRACALSESKPASSSASRE